MANPGGANQYKAMAIKTASPGQILIMLYEAAIKNVRKAIEAIEKKNIAEKGTHIGKTHDIIIELQSSLNHELGGQIAADLERLYNYVSTQLVRANMENSVEALKNIQVILENLLDGWKSAVSQVQKGQADVKGQAK